MESGRRRFIKASIGLGILIIGYLAWNQYYQPTQEDIGGNNSSSGGENGGQQSPEEQPQELNIEFTEYPKNSPLGYGSPYLVLEPRSSSQNGDTVFLTLYCHNRGDTPSTAILEIYRIDEGFSFPLKLSELPRIYNSVVHLSPGSSIPFSTSLPVSEDIVGYLFILSDPLLDSCPRNYNSFDELENYIRHVIYFGK